MLASLAIILKFHATYTSLQFFSESLTDSQNSPSSFSSIFSAISDAGRAFIGGGSPSEGRAGRQSKKKSGRLRKMSGFDVKKLKNANIKRSGQFSDLVDIFQNGQRQGVMVLRSGSGLAFSSPRPPVGGVTTATDRSFFPPQKPSPFPFDRKIHQNMKEFSNSFSPIRQNQQLITNQQLNNQNNNPFTPSAPFSTSFPPSTTQNSFAFPQNR